MSDITDQELQHRYGARPEWYDTGHINTTMIVANLAKIDNTLAQEIAIHCQLPDYFKISYSAGAPLWAWVEGRGHNARLISTFLHGFHGGGPDEVRARQIGFRDAVREMMQQGAPSWQIGFAVHAFGDAYAHTFACDGGRQAYGYPLGHAMDFIYCEKPDHISQHPDLYLDYCRALFYALCGEAAEESLEFAEFEGAFRAIINHPSFVNAAGSAQEYIITDFVTRKSGAKIEDSRLDAAGAALDYDAVIGFVNELAVRIDQS